MLPRSPAGLGLGTRLQRVPFQCRIKVLAWPWLSKNTPSAHTSLLERALTPDSSLSDGDGFGLGTRAQRMPFQCSTSVLCRSVRLTVSPTAQTSMGDTAATLSRLLSPVSGLAT